MTLRSFLYLDDLGAPARLLGLSVTATCVAEVPVFHYSGRIIGLLGERRASTLVLAAFVARMLAYSSMASWPTLWLLLPVELLHGLTFGLAWALGTAFARGVAPPGLEATMQAAFASSYFGVGTGLGGLVGGLFYAHAGPAACFLLQAAVIVTGWGATSAARSWWNRSGGASLMLGPS